MEQIKNTFNSLMFRMKIFHSTPPSAGVMGRQLDRARRKSTSLRRAIWRRLALIPTRGGILPALLEDTAYV